MEISSYHLFDHRLVHLLQKEMAALEHHTARLFRHDPDHRVGD